MELQTVERVHNDLRRNALADLKEGPVHYTDRRAVGRRLDILNDLEKRGLITMRIVEDGDQESYLEVKLT